MAKRIKGYVFSCLGWRLTACCLDGNSLRCKFEERDKTRGFTYDIDDGILMEVTQVSGDQVKKVRATPYNEDYQLEDVFQPEKTKIFEMEFFSDLCDDFNTNISTDQYLQQASLVRWLRGGSSTWEDNNEVQQIISRFTNQSLDAKRLIQDLNTMENNVFEWDEIIDCTRFGGGVKFKQDLKLEDLLDQVYFPEY